MKPLEIASQEAGSQSVLGGDSSAPGGDPNDLLPIEETSTIGRPQGLSLRANFSWTLAGNIIYAGCQWAMLIVLARLGRTEMVGQFALGLAVTAPVLMCSNLNLRAVQATDARRDFSFGDYWSLRVMTTIIALFVIVVVAVCCGYRSTTLAVILLLGAAKCFEALSDTFYGVLQQNEQMRPIAISMVIKGILSLAGLTLGLYLTGSLPWAVFVLCIMWAGVLVFYDVPQGMAMVRRDEKQARFSFVSRHSWPIAVRLAWLAAPMGIVMFLISLTSNVPRYFVEHHLGLHELGIFAAITYLIVAGSTVAAALGQSAMPRLSQLYASHENAGFAALLWKLAAMVTIVGLSAILVAALAGKPILGLLYGAEYSPHGVLFTWLMVAAWLGYLGSMLNYGMNAARLFRVQTLIYFAALVTTTISCWLLVPLLGLLGAAIAMGVGSVIQLAASTVVVFQAVRSRPPQKEDLS